MNDQDRPSRQDPQDVCASAPRTPRSPWRRGPRAYHRSLLPRSIGIA